MPGYNDPGLAFANSIMSAELKKQFSSELDKSNQAQREMPQYVSHKKVWALKIDGTLCEADGSVRIGFADGYEDRVFSATEMMNKPEPKPGMYMVQYEDGYISFSPGKAFEEGYTLIEPKRRPTIAELEAILNSEEDTAITINPDGSITAK